MHIFAPASPGAENHLLGFIDLDAQRLMRATGLPGANGSLAKRCTAGRRSDLFLSSLEYRISLN